MKRGLGYLTVMMFTVMLVGCQPQYQKQPAFIDPISLSGKACVTRCSQDQTYCEQRSSKTLSGCKEAAYHRALVDLESYQAHYDTPGRPEKSVDDFYDDSACQLAVPCRQVYNQCFIQCGGRVTQKNVCVKNCPKATPSEN